MFSLSQFPASLFSHTITFFNCTLRLHYTTPQPLLPATFLTVSLLPVLRMDQICGISAISAFSKSGFMLVFIGTACSKILDSFRTFVHDFKLWEIICWATESSFRWIFSIVFTLRFNWYDLKLPLVLSFKQCCPVSNPLQALRLCYHFRNTVVLYSPVTFQF